MKEPTSRAHQQIDNRFESDSDNDNNNDQEEQVSMENDIETAIAYNTWFLKPIPKSSRVAKINLEWGKKMKGPCYGKTISSNIIKVSHNLDQKQRWRTKRTYMLPNMTSDCGQPQENKRF